jgi:hypothetical protein
MYRSPLLRSRLDARSLFSSHSLRSSTHMSYLYVAYRYDTQRDYFMVLLIKLQPILIDDDAVL